VPLSNVPPSTILVIDDNQDDRALVARELLRVFPHFTVVEVGGPDGLTSAVAHGGFALVITDYQLQWSTGLKVLQLIKGHYPDCPVIMFTATGTQEIAVEAMKNGLDDYLIKSPAHYARLAAAVAAAFHRRDERLARRRAEDELRRALAEKELLLKELYHRVKNNLQIVSSLLDLQAATISQPDMTEIFRISQSRVRAIALVHERLYQSEDLAKVGFSAYAQELVADLLSSYGEDPEQLTSRILVDPEAEAMTVDIAVPCGLIINELVSNSIKYAFPGERAGELRVELHVASEMYTLTVADDGIGLPSDFELPNANTLGMTLVHSLVHDQLNGSVETTVEEGTAFRITFPRRSTR
jgi:two-component sensor histidine kinase